MSFLPPKRCPGREAGSECRPARSIRTRGPFLFHEEHEDEDGVDDVSGEASIGGAEVTEKRFNQHGATEDRRTNGAGCGVTFSRWAAGLRPAQRGPTSMICSELPGRRSKKETPFVLRFSVSPCERVPFLRPPPLRHQDYGRRAHKAAVPFRQLSRHCVKSSCGRSRCPPPRGWRST